MAANIGGVVIDLRLASAAFTRDVGKATNALEQSATKMRLAMRNVERAGKSVERQFSQLRAGAAALAGALAVRQFAQFTRSAIDSAGAIQDVADKVSVTTKELQQLRFAAAQSGVGISALDMGLQRFSRRIAEAAQGQGELIKTAKLYGVALRDTDGQMRGSIAVLKDFADVIKNAESRQEQLRIAFKLFDSEGAALVNTLRDGRVGLEEYMRQAEAFGAVMSSEVIAQAKLAGDNLAALEMVYQASFSTSIIREFAAGLTLTKENIEAVREAGENFGRIVGAAMRVVVEAAKFVGENIREITAALAALIALKASAMFLAVAGAAGKLVIQVYELAKAIKAADLAATKTLPGILAKLAALGVAALAAKLGFDLFADSVSDGAKAAEDAADRAGNAQSTMTQKAFETIEALERERDHQMALAKAQLEGAKAVETVNEGIEVHNKLIEAGTTIKTEEGKQIAALVVEIRKYRREIEDTIKIQRAQKDAAISAAKAQAAAIVDPKLRREAELAIERQEKINELMEEYGTVAEGTGKKLLELWDQQAVAEEQVRFWEEVRRQAEDVSKDIGDFLVDGFVNAEKGGKSAFENIWEGAKAGAKRFIANLASLFLQQKLILPIVTSVIGSAPGLFGVPTPGGGAGGGLGGLLGGGGGGGSGGGGFGVGIGDIVGLGSTLTASGSLFGGTLGGFGALNQFGASIGFGVPGLSGALTSATLSSVLGVAGLGALAGGLLAEPLGLNPTGSTIGAGLGAGIGFMVGGPIGALIGGGLGMLGGLFGGKPSVGPNATAKVRLDSGLANFAVARADNGGDEAGAASFGRTVAEGINQVLTAAGGASIIGGRSLLVGSFPSQGGIFSEVNGERRTFGEDSEAAGTDAILRTFASANLGGISGQLEQAIRRAAQTAKDLEQFGSDVEFAANILGEGLENLSAFDRALKEIDDRFAEMTDRAKRLGLSLNDINAAREREIEAATLQARAPFLQAAGGIASFLRGTEAQFLSPAAQLQAAQGQFGELLNRVRGGDVSLTGDLLNTAQGLLGLGRQNFASGVSFANLETFVRSSLLSVGETLASDEFFDAQVEATRQQTAVQVDAIGQVRDAIGELKREFQLLRKEMAA